MAKNTIAVSCIKRYVKIRGKYNIEVCVKDPGDEWGHLYLCRNCGEIVYSYALIQDVNQKPCPKCNVRAESNFVDYPKNIMFDGKLYEVDYDQINVRFNEPTEVVPFLYIKIDKNNNIFAKNGKGRQYDTRREEDKSLGKNIKDGWDHLLSPKKKGTRPKGTG